MTKLKISYSYLIGDLLYYSGNIKESVHIGES